MKASLYLRVSTIEQAEHGYSIDEQRERLISYCKAMGWDVAGIYIDPGFSGSNMERPGLKNMIAEIKNYDKVVVYKLDRLSRSQKDTLTIIEDTFIKNNIDFVSLMESLDTSTAFGRATIGILSAFAQLERENFKERSKLGRTGRARTGKWVGAGKPPIGYEYDVDKQELVINEYEAQQIKTIFDLYIKGKSYVSILNEANKLGFKHKYGEWNNFGNLANTLKNPVYTGKVKFNGQYFPGNHQAIITEEVFNKTQELIKERTNTDVYKQRNAFSHLLWCGECGTHMGFRHKKDRFSRQPRFYCRSKDTANKRLNIDCSIGTFLAAEVEEFVLDKINSLPTDKRKLEKAMGSSAKKDLSWINKRLDEIVKQSNRILELYQVGTIEVDLLNKKIKELQEEKSKLVDLQEQELSEKENKKSNLLIMQKAIIDIKKNWNKMELNAKINTLNVLIDRIILNCGNIEIYWNNIIESDE